MKIPFIKENEIKTLLAEGKQREFIVSRPVLKEMLEKVLEVKGKKYKRET